MSFQTSPFQAGGALVPGASVYVNRPEDTAFLRLMRQPQASWINIYGCRTMGKTSLYTQHERLLGQEHIELIAVDLATDVGRRHRTPSAWLRSLAAAIATELRIDEELLTSSVGRADVDTSLGIAFERLLVEGLLTNRQGRLLLLFDESDYFSEVDYCDEILFAFRHIQATQARSRSDKLARLSMCFVGLDPLPRLGKPGAANTSPFCSSIEMCDFDCSPETVDVLGRGFPSDQVRSEPLISRILELSGGQPFLTMKLLEQVHERQCHTVEAAQKMAEDLVPRSGLGRDLQLFENIERALLEEESGPVFTALRTYESLLEGDPAAHAGPGADLLLTYGLIRRNAGNLEVKGELFQRRFDKIWASDIRSRIASRKSQYRGGSKSKGRICVINTGGTIGMVQRGNEVVAPRDAQEFMSYFTSLDSIADEVEFINLFPPRDSINVFPQQWVTLAQYIHARRHDGFNGFVVAHGTDTMAYTASAVAFALGRQLRFPVVFTGAQTTPDVAYGDAHVNLYRACEVAKKDIPEVVISFGNFVYRAVRAQKRDDRRFDGFESPTYPPLAEITGEINVRRELRRKLPREKADIRLRAEFEESVLIVPQFPGLEPDFFESLLGDHERFRCRGVIVQTLGAGNVTSEAPYSFIPFVERAYRQGIPVIVTSQYPPDPGVHAMYKPAQAPIDAGAIHAGNMTQSAAVTKFRWVLASVLRQNDWPGLPPEKKRQVVARLMVEQSVIGEF